MGHTLEQTKQPADAYQALIVVKSLAPEAGGITFILGAIIIACVNPNVFICGMFVFGSMFCFSLDTDIETSTDSTNKKGLSAYTQSISVQHSEGEGKDKLMHRINRFITGGAAQ